MKKNKRRNVIMLLILLVCAVTIGFAILTTTLEINGIGLVKGNKWDIHWENVDNIDGVDATTPVIDAAKTTVTYEINLAEPGDYYEFTVDAKNDGTIDAEIAKIENYFYEADGETEIEEPEYFGYSITDEDDKPLEIGKRLNVGQSHTYKVRIDFNTNVNSSQLPKEGATIISKFTVTYIQAELKSCGASFADASWEEIQAEIMNPNCKPKFEVGDIKKINIDIDEDGNDEEYVIRLVNKSTPKECSKADFSQTACGYVFEFVDVVERHIMNDDADNLDYQNGRNNVGSWKYSNLRAYLNNGIYKEGEQEEVNYATTGFFNKLPEDLRKVIIPTKVVTGFGCRDFVRDSSTGGFKCNTYAGVYQGDNNGKNFVTYDKLFVYSPHEIYEAIDVESNYTSDITTHDFRIGDSAYYQSRQEDYYDNLDVNRSVEARQPVRKKYNGNYYNWWLRTPRANSYWSWYYVGSEGSDGSNSDMTGGINNEIGTDGVVPVFRIG